MNEGALFIEFAKYAWHGGEKSHPHVHAPFGLPEVGSLRVSVHFWRDFLVAGQWVEQASAILSFGKHGGGDDEMTATLKNK